MSYNFKSISPIISVILIVVITIIIITILLTWGIDFVSNATSHAEESIDFSCESINLNIEDCDYNSLTNTLSFILINTSKISFQNNSFNLSLLDSNSQTTFIEDILDSNSLLLGQSKTITVSDYNAVMPIKIKVFVENCARNYTEITCR